MNKMEPKKEEINKKPVYLTTFFKFKEAIQEQVNGLQNQVRWVELLITILALGLIYLATR